ncbi:MAG: hypothetical protein MHPSP_003280, partial [Paramarteilia canceri]
AKTLKNLSQKIDSKFESLKIKQQSALSRPTHESIPNFNSEVESVRSELLNLKEKLQSFNKQATPSTEYKPTPTHKNIVNFQ